MSGRLIDSDGIVAFWFLTGGAWASEPDTGDPLQENCRQALRELLEAAVDTGAVSRGHCDELALWLKEAPSSPRCLLLAVAIANEIPEHVVARVTDTHLSAFEPH